MMKSLSPIPLLGFTVAQLSVVAAAMDEEKLELTAIRNGHKGKALDHAARSTRLWKTAFNYIPADRPGIYRNARRLASPRSTS